MTGASVLSIAGLLTAAAGVGVLRFCWRNPARWHAPGLALGWAVLGASVFLLSSAFGAEPGSAFAVTAYSIAGMAAVLLNIEVRTSKRPARMRTTAPAESSPNLPRALLRTLTTGILSAVAALWIGITYTACAPLPGPDALVFSSFAVLLLWSSFVVWAMSATKVVPVALILAVGAAIAYGVVRGTGLCA